MNARFLTLAIVLVGLTITPTWADEPTTAPATAPTVKAAVPEAAALKEAQKVVNGIYAEDIAKAKKPQEKADLAKKLLQAATETKNDAAGKYVLLGMAKDIGVQAGDVETTFSAVDQLTESYLVEELKLKTDALAKLSRTPGVDHGAIVDKANAWIDDAFAADQYDIAKQIAQLALGAANATKDPDVIRPANARVQEVVAAAKAYEEVKKALATIAQTPNDPTANLSAGRFYCLTKGQWEKGLLMLALGSDAALKAMAEKDAAKPTEADKQVELGNEWCKLAEKYPAAAKRSVQDRAVEWFKKAMPNLTGLEKAKLEKRVAELTQGPARTIKPGGEELILDLGKNVKMKLVRIPAGRFMMGSPNDEKDSGGWEHPQHEVTISKPFYMGIYTVTQEQYDRVTGHKGWEPKFRGLSNPAEAISWEEAMDFCKAISKKTGKNVTLPTEAQWEYACRAGTKTRFYFGDDEDKLGDYAWYAKNSDNKMHLVGQKKPNDWGLYDMHGNVWQWCSDWIDWGGDNYYSAKENDKDPKGPASGKARVCRGSAFDFSSDMCRSANRGGMGPDYHGASGGFRVVVLSGPN